MGKYTFKGKAAVSVAAIAALTLTGCASVGGGGNDSNGGGGESSASAQSGGVVNVAETNKFSGANPGYTKTNLDINGHVAEMTREGFITVDLSLIHI